LADLAQSWAAPQNRAISAATPATRGQRLARRLSRIRRRAGRHDSDEVKAKTASSAGIPVTSAAASLLGPTAARFLT
jgi:hypothetical protein